MRSTLARRLGVATIALIATTLGLATPAHAETGGSISGHFLETSGDPAPTSTVGVYDASTWSWITNVSTGAGGAYQVPALPAGDYLLSFQVDGSSLAQWAHQKQLSWEANRITVTDGADTVVDETRIPSGTIAGTVTDASGKPAADVQVSAWDPTGGSGWGFAVTGADGGYRIDMYPGSYVVSFQAPGGSMQYAHQQVDYGAAARIPVTAGQTTALDEQMLPTGSLSGRFTDAGGAPVASEYVSVVLPNGSSAGPSGMTDADGRFTIPNVFAGDYKVQFIGPDWTTNQWAYGKRTLEQADVITVRAGEDTVVNDSALGTPGATISGHFRETNGDPAPTSIVSVYNAESWSWVGNTTTDADGAFRVGSLPAGDYLVGFQVYGSDLTQWAHQQQQQWMADRITVTEDAETVVDETRLPSGTIAGTVTDAGGNPVGGVSVEAFNSASGYSSTVTTQADGTYRADVYPGDYTVSFRLPSGAQEYAHQKLSRNDALPVPVSAGQTVTLDEKLLPTGSISGRFTDATGAPVAGESVGLDVPNEGSTNQSTSTDADGRFTLHDVFVGGYYVRFTAPDWSSSQYAYHKLSMEQADVITVRAGQDTVVDDSALGTGTLTITARDSITGAAIADFCASADDKWGCSDGSGTITLTRVREGGQTVMVYPHDPMYFSSPAITVTVAAGKNTDVSVPLREGGAIDVVVRDRATGDPVASTCLAPLAIGNAVAGYAGYCTDEQGKARIAPLAAGDYTVYALPHDGTHGSQWVGPTGGTGDQRKAAEVTVSPGDVTDAPVVLLDGAGSVTGTVTGPDGAPVRHGYVTTLTSDPGYGGDLQGTSVGADGRYTLTGLGPYKWPLLFHGEGLVPTWSGGAGDRYEADMVPVAAGATATANAVLSAGITLTGTVTASTGPMSWGRLIAYDKTTGDVLGSADYGADGRYSMRLFGSETAQIQYMTSINDVWVQGWYADAGNRADATPIDLPHGKDLALDFTITVP